MLLCEEGKENKLVAAMLGVAEETVSKWRARFLRQRLRGLDDEKRAGAPRKCTEAKVNEVLACTRNSAPNGAKSAREVARATGLSHLTVLRIWHAFGVMPRRTAGRGLRKSA